jgi:hypothetical protein
VIGVKLTSLLTSRVALVIAIGTLLVVALLVGVPVTSADSPLFLSRYPELLKNHDNLQTSQHKGLKCTDCHVDPRGAVARDLAVTADFYAGLFSRRETPLYVTFPKPTRDACLACHREAWSDESSRTAEVPHPAHARVAAETRECVTCHKWAGHDDASMQKHKTMPFSGVCVAYGCHVGWKQTKECAGCHHSLATSDWKTLHPTYVRESGPNGCVENCHTIDQCQTCHTTGKKPEVKGVTVQTGLKEVQDAHVKADWPTTHGTFAMKDQTQCMKCHVSDGECKACHARRPAFHGATTTWIGTHKNVAKGKEAVCTAACHEKAFCDECHKQFKEMR